MKSSTYNLLKFLINLTLASIVAFSYKGYEYQMVFWVSLCALFLMDIMYELRDIKDKLWVKLSVVGLELVRESIILTAIKESMKTLVSMAIEIVQQNLKKTMT